MEDRRAHERIDDLESTLQKHIQDHAQFKIALEENTKITQTVADNTSELVTLIRGAKGFRAFIVWVTPVALAVGAGWGLLKLYFKGTS